MQYTFDTHFFDEINTQEKAYVLGFLFADGYNYEKRGVVSLSLQEKDKEILDKISKCLKNTKPLQFIDMIKYHKGKSHQNQYRLSISSHYTSAILAQLGCGQKKSYTCQFPAISSEMTPHFLRGYFDGDGCISYTPNTNGCPCGSISFVGAVCFCKSVKMVLKSLEINCSVSRSKRCDYRIRRLAFGGRKQLNRFYEFIYKNSTISLERKKKKFDEFVSESGMYLQSHKSLNIYKNTKGCKKPWRVVKSLKGKTIHLGSFLTRNEAESVSVKWDTNYRSMELL